MSVKSKKPKTTVSADQSDQAAALEAFFASYRHNADLFLPDKSFYDLAKAGDVEAMAARIFKWLGIKHYSVDLAIDPSQQELGSYASDGANHVIRLGQPALDDPLVCAAALAHQLMHFLVYSRLGLYSDNAAENERLANLATIHSGLGVLVINGTARNPECLPSMSLPAYAEEFAQYSRDHSLVPGLWQPHLLRNLHDLFNLSPLQPSRLALYLKELSKTKRLPRLRLAAPATFAAAILVFSLYAFATQPRLPAELAQQRDRVSLLRKQLQDCQAAQIETSPGQQDPCTEIKTRHDQQLDKYNQQVSGL